MTIDHGFEQITEQQVPELKLLARLYRHVKTGAQLMSLITDDENKVFGITFRTPPTDSTGVAHILEHSVLCGSRKYPVKEPFVELLKGSLKTFLNAFTYPDKTCYPVASQNPQDFYNLIDVYLDAVFHPRITPLIFQQEGWHLELEKPDDGMFFKGVVYNEMKGAYSSPDSVLYEFSQQSLFPDNTYGLDSGGDPEKIIDLTFEQFQEFHRKYYHPSNARIYFYGDDDPAARLRMVNEYLRDFERLEIDSTIALQRCFDQPKQIEKPFSVSRNAADDGETSKGMVTVNWLLPETSDAELNLAFHVLEYILLGMPGSPLRKALMDSGMGEAIAGSGLEGELRQMFLSTGLKGIAVDHADQIESLVLRTLADLTANGIDPATIEAALNTIEFRLRENNTGSFPRGLLLMLRSLTTWLYDADPMTMLRFEPPLEAIKAKLASGSRYFEKLIEQHLLNNTHRTRLLLKPDPELEERMASAERERIEKIRATMGPRQIQSVIENTRALRTMQETPDPPEALQTIPSLKIDDLSRANSLIPLEEVRNGENMVLYHDLFCNGIVYLDVGFDLRALPQKYLSYLPLFTRALVELGTETEDYVRFNQRISRKTGGIHPEFFTATARNGGDSAVWFFLRGKAMLSQSRDLLDILRDMLLRVKLDNRERFRQMVLEDKARQEQKLVPSGHQVVNLRLRSHFSKADWVAEQLNGLSYLMAVRQLARLVEEDWDQVLTALLEIKQMLIRRSAMLVNVTTERDGWNVFAPLLTEFIGDLPEAAGKLRPADWTPEHSPLFEGLVIPAQVNYVGKGCNVYAAGHQFNGSFLVVSRYIRNSWLWERIRVQGGAYGAFCLFDRLSGSLTFISYRDPNLLKTLQCFDQTIDFLKDLDLGEDELAKAIIGTIGDIDAYLLPDAKGYTSLLRYLTGDSDARRQRMRDQVLATNMSDFKAFAEMLEDFKKNGLVKVLGSQSAIEESLISRPEWLKIVKVL